MLPVHECVTAALIEEGFRRSGAPTACHLPGSRLRSSRGLEALLPAACRRLDLSHNRLTAFGGLPRDSDLRELLLVANELTSMPDVARAKKLEVLSLGFNALAGVGGALSEGAPGRFLRALHLNDNALRSCEGLAKLPLLVELDLSRNQLRGLEGLSGGGLKHLAVLRVAGNPLESLAGLGCGRGELPALRELDASGCALRSLRGLEGASALVSLDVAGNAPLASLDFGGLGGALPALCELRAARCAALAALPGAMAALFPALTLLDLSECGLGRGGGGLRAALAPARALRALVELLVAGSPAAARLSPAGAAREAAAALPGVLCVDGVWVGAAAEAEGAAAAAGLVEEAEEAAAAAAEAPLSAAAAAAAAVPLQALSLGGEAPEAADARAAIARLRERVRGGVDGAAAAGAARWAQMGWGAPPDAAGGAPPPPPPPPSAASGPEGGRFAHILSGAGRPAPPTRTGGSLRQALVFARLQNEAEGGAPHSNKYLAAAAAKRVAARSPPG